MSSPPRLSDLISRPLTIPEVSNEESCIHPSIHPSPRKRCGCAGIEPDLEMQDNEQVSPPRRPRSSGRQDHCATRRGALSVRVGCWGRLLGGMMLGRVLTGNQEFDKWKKGDTHWSREQTGKNTKGTEYILVQQGSGGVWSKMPLQGIVRGGQKLNHKRPFGLRNLGFILMRGHWGFLEGWHNQGQSTGIVVEKWRGSVAHTAAAVDTEGWLTSEGQRATLGTGRDVHNSVHRPRKEGTGSVGKSWCEERYESVWRAQLLRRGDRTRTHIPICVHMTHLCTCMTRAHDGNTHKGESPNPENPFSLISNPSSEPTSSEQCFSAASFLCIASSLGRLASTALKHPRWPLSQMPTGLSTPSLPLPHTFSHTLKRVASNHMVPRKSEPGSLWREGDI